MEVGEEMRGGFARFWPGRINFSVLVGICEPLLDGCESLLILFEPLFNACEPLSVLFESLFEPCKPVLKKLLKIKDNYHVHALV